MINYDHDAVCEPIIQHSNLQNPSKPKGTKIIKKTKGKKFGNFTKNQKFPKVKEQTHANNQLRIKMAIKI